MAEHLPFGFTIDGVKKMAWRAAKMHPTGVLSLAERADVAEFALWVMIYEASTEPGRRELFGRAVNAISMEADRELREHGYSTRTHATMKNYAAWWYSGTGDPDGLAESVTERIALHQILPVTEHAEVLRALADYGSHAAAAESLGWSRNKYKIYLSKARRSFRTYWNWPDPPGRAWGPDHAGRRHGSIRDRLRDRRKYQRRKDTAA